jgi:uncharacterized membrane protein YqiK
VSVDINRNQAQAREAQANGEAAYVRLTGEAEADKLRAIGLAEAKATEALGVAKATGYEAQREAIGEMSTALVAVAGAIGEGGIDIMPEVLVTGGGGSFEGLAATLMQALRNGSLTVGTERRTELGEALAETAQQVADTEEPLGG